MTTRIRTLLVSLLFALTIVTGLIWQVSAASWKEAAPTVNRIPFEPATVADDQFWDDQFALPGIGRINTPNEIEATAVDANGNLAIAHGARANNSNVYTTSQTKIDLWDGATWQSLGTTCVNPCLFGDDRIDDMAFNPVNGNLVVIGRFDAIHTPSSIVFANNIAEWNGTSWQALSFGLSDISNGANGKQQLAFDSTGLLYIGKPPESLDPATYDIQTWNGSTYSSITIGITTVEALGDIAVDNDDNLIITGRWSTGQFGEEILVYRWNGSTWTELLSRVTQSTPDWLNELVAVDVASNGNLHFAANLTDGSTSEPYGTVFVYNGSTWSTLGELTTQAQPLGFLTNKVRDVIVLADGTVHLGGDFRNTNGRFHVARWNGSDWEGVEGGVNNYGAPWRGEFVRHLNHYSNTLYIAGTFETAGDAGAANLAQWHNGAWSPICEASGCNGIHDQVLAMAAGNNDDLYAAGTFLQAGTISATRIARWDNANFAWSPLGAGLTSGWSTDAPSVRALAVDGTNVYAGGLFSQTGNAPISNNIARWDTVAQAWQSLGTGTNGQVEALAAHDGKIYVAGQFQTAGGVNAKGVALWNSNTSTWSALADGWDNCGFFFCWPDAMVVDPVTGDLYASGSRNFDSNQVHRWDGTNWTSLPVLLDGVVVEDAPEMMVFHEGVLYAAQGINAGGYLAKYSGGSWTTIQNNVAFASMALHPLNGELIFGASFTTPQNESGVGLVRYNPTADTWSISGSGINREGRPEAVAVVGNDIYVAGQEVSMAGGKASHGFGRYNDYSADLAISKSTDRPQLLPTVAFTYILTVTNNGPDYATHIVFTDTLPSEVSYQSHTHSDCAENGGTLVCELPSLAPTAAFTMAINVVPTQPLTITNVATVTARERDASVTNNTAIHEAIVENANDLRLFQSIGTATVEQPVTVTLIISNVGASLANQVLLTQAITDSFLLADYDAGNGQCGLLANEVICSMGVISGNASASVTLVLTPLLSGTFPTSATVSMVELDVDRLNNQVMGNIVVAVDGVDLALRKDMEPQNSVAGQAVTYTLLAENLGSNAASQLVITDSLPLGVNYQSASAECAHTAGIVTCTAATLAPAGMVSFTIVAVPTAGGVITNSAEINSSDPDLNLTNNSATASHTVEAIADIAISQSGVAAGDQLLFTAVVSNSGVSSAENVLVTHTLPAQTNLITHTTSSGSCTAQSDKLVCSIGTLPSGDQVGYQIILSTTQPTGSFTNSVAATTTTPETTFVNNQAETGLTLAGADLAISKSAEHAIVSPNEPLVYTIVVTNNGTLVATDVKIVDTLPISTTYDGSEPNCTDLGRAVTCTVASLAVGATHSVTIEATTTATGTLVNQAAVFSAETDPDLNNNSAISVIEVRESADLSLDLSLSNEMSAENEMVIASLTVGNLSPFAANRLTVTLLLPSGVAVGTLPPDCSAASQVVTCVAVSAGVQFDVPLTAASRGLYVISAEVSSATPDNDPSNNAATASLAVDLPDLLLTQIEGASQSTPTDSISYTLQIDNVSGATVNDVTVVLNLSGIVEFVDATASQGSGCTLNGTIVICQIGSLSGRRASATVELNVIGALTGTAQTVGYVSGNSAEIDLQNNLITLETEVGNGIVTAIQLSNASIKTAPSAAVWLLLFVMLGRVTKNLGRQKSDICTDL